MFPELLTKKFLGNTLLAYAVFTTLLAVGVLTIHIVRFFVLRTMKKWAERTTTQFDDFVVESLQKFTLPLLYLALFNLAVKNLSLSAGADKIINALSVVILTFTGISFLTHSVRFALFNVYAKKFPDQPDVNNRFSALLPAITIFIWILGLVFLLDNLGFKISAIVAGLGIGGVAVALAASVLLNDLFAYFAIMFDQPFVIGDFIIIGEFKGTVEKIGIKTTRLRSLGGELLVFSNKDLTDSRLRNFKRMNQRRAEFKLGLTYDTSNEKLQDALSVVRETIQKIKLTKLDRAHFSTFADSALIIEVIYFVDSPEYNVYMNIQQEINLEIKKEFEKRGIAFAFPTQTLHVASH